MAIHIYTLLEKKSQDHDAKRDLESIFESFYVAEVERSNEEDTDSIPQAIDDTQMEHVIIEAPFLEDTSRKYNLDGYPGFVSSETFPYPKREFIDSLILLCKSPMKLNQHPDIRSLGITNNKLRLGYRYGIVNELTTLFCTEKDDEFDEKSQYILSLDKETYIEQRRQKYVDEIPDFKGLRLCEEEKKLRDLCALIHGGRLPREVILPTYTSLHMINFMREVESTEEYQLHCNPETLVERARQKYVDNHPAFAGMDLRAEEKKLENLTAILTSDRLPEADELPSKEAIKMINYMKKEVEPTAEYKRNCNPEVLMEKARQKYIDSHPIFAGMNLRAEEEKVRSLNALLVSGEFTENTPLPSETSLLMIDYIKDVEMTKEYQKFYQNVQENFEGIQQYMLRSLKREIYGEFYLRAEDALQKNGFVMARISLASDHTLHVVQELLTKHELPTHLVIIDEEIDL